MPLDLEPIRARLAVIDRPFWRDACEPIEGEDTFPADRVFVQHAPDDIATLIEEVERLRSELDDTKAALEDMEIDCDNMRSRLDDLDIDL